MGELITKSNDIQMVVEGKVIVTDEAWHSVSWSEIVGTEPKLQTVDNYLGYDRE